MSILANAKVFDYRALRCFFIYRKFGKIVYIPYLFIFQGNVYVKCPSIAAAIAAVNALHGRWFAGEFHLFFCVIIMKDVI